MREPFARQKRRESFQAVLVAENRLGLVARVLALPEEPLYRVRHGVLEWRLGLRFDLEQLLDRLLAISGVQTLPDLFPVQLAEGVVDAPFAVEVGAEGRTGGVLGAFPQVPLAQFEHGGSSAQLRTQKGHIHPLRTVSD